MQRRHATCRRCPSNKYITQDEQTFVPSESSLLPAPGSCSLGARLTSLLTTKWPYGLLLRSNSLGPSSFKMAARSAIVLTRRVGLDQVRGRAAKRMAQ